MAADNLVHATNSMRSSVSSLKKKLSNLRVQVEYFDAEIEKIEGKFEKILTQADIYKAKLEREMGREVRRLERELALLRKNGSSIVPLEEAGANDLKIASSVAILDGILRQISAGADDFRLISEAFLFPAVIERILAADEEAYFLEEVPPSAAAVVQQGRQYVAWIRDEYETHLTDPDAWDDAIGPVTDWWRNNALPLIYGCRDEQWDIDVPLTLTEMLTWRDVPAERPITFSAVFDAYEVFRKFKDQVYEPTGLRKFELQQFTYHE